MVNSSIELGTVSVDEAAAILGLSRERAYLSVKNGELPALTFGRRIRISRRVLERMLDGERPADVEQS